MGAAAYNRGSSLVAREADERMPEAGGRAERMALMDEIAHLRERVSMLERDLTRARRCLAAERHGREQIRARLATNERTYEFAVGVLCRRAFPGGES